MVRRAHRLLTILLPLVLLAGCSGYTHFADPSGDGGDWLMSGGSVRRCNSASQKVAAPLVENWRYQAADLPWGMVASQGVAVYAGLSRGISGLDVETGEQLWQWSLPATPADAPAINQDSLYLAIDLPLTELWCLSLSDGSRCWRVLVEESHPRALLATDDGVWLLTNRALLRYHRDDGELLDEEEPPGRPLLSQLTLWNDEPILVFRGVRGSGLWSPEWDEPLWLSGEPAAGPLVTERGQLCWANRDGSLWLLESKEAEPRQILEAQNTPPAGIACQGDRIILLGRNGSLMLVEPTGEATQLREAEAITLAPPLWLGELIWLIEAEGDLIACSAESGEVVYRHPLEEAPQALTPLDDSLLLSLNDGTQLLLSPNSTATAAEVSEELER
ncbi:PQQ-like beta-propeller repeat protein [bacterium]|nr:PQQ-like beta-propeller repeat protein [bacterium]